MPVFSDEGTFLWADLRAVGIVTAHAELVDNHQAVVVVWALILRFRTDLESLF
jgi:hypothetical protein